MGHEILFLSDDEMLDGHDFTLCVWGPRVVILYRASAVRAAVDPDRAARVLEDSWAAYRAYCNDPNRGGGRMLRAV